MKKNDYTHQFTTLIHELGKDYPNLTIGMHLSTAFEGYGDIWSCPDKELVFALEKYKTLLEMDIAHPQPVEDVDRIIADAADLSALLLEEEEDEDI